VLQLVIKLIGCYLRSRLRIVGIWLGAREIFVLFDAATLSFIAGILLLEPSQKCVGCNGKGQDEMRLTHSLGKMVLKKALRLVI